MRGVKRLISLSLAALLFVSAPVNAYASATAVATWTVGSYIINLILNACGIDLSLSSVTAVLGQWAGYDEYLEKGEKGQLGTFSQYLYDNAYGEEAAQLTEARRQEFEDLTRILNDAVNASWGAVVTGVSPLINAIKEWVKSLAGYGTETLTYSVPAHTMDSDNGWEDEYFCTATDSILPAPPSYSYAYRVINKPENEYWFMSRAPVSGTDYYQVRNWYHTIGDDVFGLYSETERTVSLYRKSSSGGYESVSSFYYYGSVNADGTLRYAIGDMAYGNANNILCDREYLGNLPFNVFLSLDDMVRYCEDGTVNCIAKTGETFLSALSVNTEVQNSALASVPDTITLPDSAVAAEKQADAISDAVADTAALGSALDSAGLEIGWIADEVIDTPASEVTSADMQALMDKVAALPTQIVDAFVDRIQSKSDNNDSPEQASLPSIIMSKFPFCIPFDLIYLLEIMCAESEAPRFEIPIKIDYADFHYDNPFVVDFADFQLLVDILRGMLDLYFCACLISITRDLIRG